MTDKVYKSSDYYDAKADEQTTESSIPVNPFLGINLGQVAATEFAGLKDDFLDVFSAIKNFPVRSTMTVIGTLTLLYGGFKLYRKFAKIKAARSK